MSDPWRERCPEGHAAVEHHTATFYCSACGKTYPGEPLDATEHEFPVDGPDPIPPVTVEYVLRKLYHETGDTVTTTTVTDLGVRTRAIGKRLHDARDRGLVERIGAASPYRWTFTEAGLAHVRGTHAIASDD